MKRPGPNSLSRLLGLAVLCLSLGLLSSCAGISGDRGDEVAKVHYSRHLTFRAQNQAEKAATELELAVKADPNMYQAYYQLGLIYHSLGQNERARAAWERGLDTARQGPERSDYPRAKSVAEMESALASLEPLLPPLMPSSVSPAYQPPSRPKPKAVVKRGPTGIAPSTSQGYAVLVSSNQKKSSALADQKRLSAAGYKSDITTFKGKKDTWHRVWVGCCGSLDKARQMAAAVKRKGFHNAAATKR